MELTPAQIELAAALVAARHREEMVLEPQEPEDADNR